MKTYSKRNLFWDYFFKLCIALAFVAVIMHLSGCVTEKQRRKICQGCPVVIKTKDSIQIQTKDRPVKVFIHDTVKVQTPNPCAELCDSAGKLKNFNKTFPGKKGTSTKVFTRNDSLIFETRLDSLEAVVNAKDSLIKHFHERIEQVESKCERRHITDWEIFLLIVGKIAIAQTVLRYLLRLLSNYFPWLKAVVKFL